MNASLRFVMPDTTDSPPFSLPTVLRSHWFGVCSNSSSRIMDGTRCTGLSARIAGWKIYLQWNYWIPSPKKSCKQRSTQMTASAIDQSLLAALIASAGNGNPIAPGDFASMMVYDLRELEERANVPTRTAELEPQAPQLQAYMRRALYVIDSLIGMELSVDQAHFWFRWAMISEFSNKSPQQLVVKDCTEVIVASLRRVFVSQRDTMAPLWEQMRADTLSLQRDIFRDVRMLSVHEAAAICGFIPGDKAPMELARELASKGTSFFVTRNGVPVFPAYQFSPTGTKPIVARILNTLAPLRSSWEIVVWFWASNGWLDGDSPEELLDLEPDLVLDAALQEVAE